MSKPKDPAATAAAVAAEAAQIAQANAAQEAESQNHQIELNPELVAQFTQMKNARLIATMVHENAMLEVALEQSRRNEADWKAKHDALKSALMD